MTHSEGELSRGAAEPTRKTSEFTHDGVKFVVEPHIKTGERIITSLGQLAAIGAEGYKADDHVIEELTQEVDRTLGRLDESNGMYGFSRYLTNVASRRHQHTFFISKF